MEFTITCMYNLFLSIMYSVLVVCERAQYKTSCIQYKHVAVINLIISLFIVSFLVLSGGSAREGWSFGSHLLPPGSHQ